ncbi:MAG: hypothetical protein APR62_01450 [Smithella sp. SDB]|nr:MAG: hypothetical protein APR62_01450 [Smithella sp. SDB]
MKKISAYLLLLSLIIIFISACGSKTDTPTVEPSPPSTVGAQLRADAGDQQVTLYWPMVAGADTYNVYYNAGDYPTKTSYDGKITGLPSAPYTATSLTNGITYFFAFTAVSTSDGESNLSEIIPATPQGDPDPMPPEFPKNVRANAGNGEVTVTWTPVDDAEIYNVYQYSNFDDLTLAAEIKSTDGNCTGSQCSFTSPGLTNGTIYFFYLTAENNTSVKSNVVEAIPPSSVDNNYVASEGFSAPQNVSATVGDTELTLTWDPPSDDSETPNTVYNVYYDTNYPMTITADKKFPERTSPWNFSGLTNGQNYYLYVTAVLASGPSFGVYATPSTSPPPLAPVIDTTSITVDDGTVYFDWNDVAGATSYNVYSSNVMGLSKEVYSSKATATGSPLPSEFTAIDLTNDKKYFFVVTAVNANGESAESNEVSATPVAP